MKVRIRAEQQGTMQGSALALGDCIPAAEMTGDPVILRAQLRSLLRPRPVSPYTQPHYYGYPHPDPGQYHCTALSQAGQTFPQATY